MYCTGECPEIHQLNQMKINSSVLFNCIHYFLLRKSDQDKKIGRKELKAILGVSFHIPHEHKEKVINELKNHKIIIDSSRDWIKIKNSNPFK